MPGDPDDEAEKAQDNPGSGSPDGEIPARRLANATNSKRKIDIAEMLHRIKSGQRSKRDHLLLERIKSSLEAGSLGDPPGLQERPVSPSEVAPLPKREHPTGIPPVTESAERSSSNTQKGTTKPMTEQSRSKSLQEDELWRDVLEKFEDQPINAPFVVRTYQEVVRDRPLLRLIQDVNQRVGIYTNILEEVKKQPLDEVPAAPGQSTSAQLLKAKYEGLGLVPAGQMPNPYGSEAAAFALKKLRNYGTLLVDIMATCAEAIAKELKVSVNVSFKVSVNVALSPSIHLGVERPGDE